MYRNLYKRSFLVALVALLMSSVVTSGETIKAKKPCTWTVTNGVLFRCFALSPDGKIFVSQNIRQGRTAKRPMFSGIEAWNTQTGRRLWSYPMHFNPFAKLAFSPDQKLLACSAHFNPEGVCVTLHDVKAGKIVHQLRKPNAQTNRRPEQPWGVGGTQTNMYNAIKFSPYGNLLAGTEPGRSTTLDLWNTMTGEHLGAMPNDQKPFGIFFFLPDSQKIAVFNASSNMVPTNDTTQPQKQQLQHDASLHIWNFKTLQQESETKLEDLPSFELGSIEFSRDKNLFAYKVLKRTSNAKPKWKQCVYVYHTPTGKRQQVIDMKYNDSLRFTNDGKTLLGAKYKENRLFFEVADLETGKVKKRFQKKFDNKVTMLPPPTFSPDGKVLAMAIDNHVIKLYDPQTGEELASLEGPSKLFYSYAITTPLSTPVSHLNENLLFSKDGTQLISLATFGKPSVAPNGIRQLRNGKTKATAWDLGKILRQETASTKTTQPK